MELESERRAPPVAEAQYERADLSDLLHIIGRTGDQAAVEQLYRHCRKAVYAIAYAICRDPQLSEDVLQETILYVWQHAAEHKRGRNASAWIHVIARHTAIDLVRARKSWDPLDEGIRPPATYHVEHDPDGLLSLQMGLEQLTLSEAQVLVFRGMLGYSFRQIAQLLALPYRVVRYRYQKARGKMVLFLKETESTERGNGK